MGPLQRKDSASCRGAILRPHQLMDELRLWNITGWVGSEGRAQNIAPLHLIRCLIVECSGMDIPSTRCCTIWDGRGFVRFMPLVSLPGGSRHDRPSEVHCSRVCYLQAALQASPFACMEFPTICHLRWLFCFRIGCIVLKLVDSEWLKKYG